MQSLESLSSCWYEIQCRIANFVDLMFFFLENYKLLLQSNIWFLLNTLNSRWIERNTLNLWKIYLNWRFHCIWDYKINFDFFHFFKIIQKQQFEKGPSSFQIYYMIRDGTKLKSQSPFYSKLNRSAMNTTWTLFVMCNRSIHSCRLRQKSGYHSNTHNLSVK